MLWLPALLRSRKLLVRALNSLWTSGSTGFYPLTKVRIKPCPHLFVQPSASDGPPQTMVLSPPSKSAVLGQTMQRLVAPGGPGCVYVSGPPSARLPTSPMVQNLEQSVPEPVARSGGQRDKFVCASALDALGSSGQVWGCRAVGIRERAAPSTGLWPVGF